MIVSGFFGGGSLLMCFLRSIFLKLMRVLVDINDEWFVEFFLCSLWCFESVLSSLFIVLVKRVDVLILLNLLF